MTDVGENKGRLLYAASTFEHIENFHLDYINALRRDGFTVDVLARGTGSDFDIPFEKRLFSLKNVVCLRRIRQIIKRESYTAIILNTSLAAFYIRFALRGRSRPRVVNIVHGYLFGKGVNPLKSSLLLLCERLARRRTDAIIVMNREDLAIAKKHRLTDGEIYFIRGMGVSLGETATLARRLKNRLFPKGAFVLAFAGELSKRKNQSTLIDALNIIKREIPTALLCLIGEGGERDFLTKKAERLGLSDSVLFLGYRRDVPDLVRLCDVYVSASRTEGLPFNIVEALGVGKTVVASRIKGHADIIEDGKDGFLFTAGRAASLAERVIMIQRGELALDRREIRKKYLRYEKNSVFPETYSIIKTAIKPHF